VYILGVKLAKAIKKGSLLARPRFGCLRGGRSLNVTRGCALGCVYCYARSYPGAPEDEVLLYEHLPELLAAELDSPRRRSAVEWVAFNTASDSFQPHPEVLETSYRAMEVLLERGIPFSFLTKGSIPERFFELFARSPRLVSATVSLVSASPAYRECYEPGTASLSERLGNLEWLRSAGVAAQVRADPLIPFVTDGEGELRALCALLAAKGIQEVATSYLLLRPAVLENLRRELPRRALTRVLASFGPSARGNSSRWCATQQVPAAWRRKGYDRFVRVAAEFGVTCRVCACKNPDLPSGLCSTVPAARAARPRRGPRQLELFDP
jgi:DNA repair photolyase